MSSVSVITVDGPSGAGKGTISHLLAERLGWRFLDSGALYRVTGQACLIEGVAWDDHPAVTEIARHLDVSFSAADNGEKLKLIYFHPAKSPPKDQYSERLSRMMIDIGVLCG